MRKDTQASGGGKAVAISILALVVVLGGFVGYRYKAFTEGSERFPEGTKINGISCANMTVGEAAEHLTKAYNDKEYSLKSGEETLEVLSKFGASYEIKDELSKATEKNFANFLRNDLLLGYSKLKIPMKVESFSPSFERRVRKLEILKEKSAKPIRTRNAYIKLEKPDFPIMEEVYGNNTDYGLFMDAVASDIEADIFEREFNLKDYYMQPQLTKDSPEMLERQEFCKEYLMQDITYEFGKSTQKVDLKSLSKMKRKARDGGVRYDRDAIAKYVLDLAKNHNTWGMTRQFTTRSGKTINVSGGDYGYVIDQPEEAKELLNDLQKNEDVRREPVYSQRTMFGTIDNDLTGTYVEINTGTQKLWLVENGKTVFETSVVTGSPKVDLETSEGVYAITYKERNATLRGENSDGTTYESPVEYWMPFNGNIGMHDAPWKTAFGVKEHRRAPSHGCVNMPLKYAEELYGRVEAGFPVVVYKD